MQHSTQDNPISNRTLPFLAAAAIALVSTTFCVGLGTTQVAYANPTAAEKQAEAESVLANLTAMQETLDRLSVEYGEAIAAQEEAETNRDAAEARLAEINGEIEELQETLSGRARDMYRNGSVTYLDMLLGANTFEDFATSWDILNKVNESDASLVQTRKDLAVEQEEQAAIYSEQASVASQKAEEAAQAEEQAQATVAEMQATYESLSAEAAQLLEEERKAREAEEAARAAAVMAEAAAAAQQAQAVQTQGTSQPAAPSGSGSGLAPGSINGSNAVEPSGDGAAPADNGTAAETTTEPAAETATEPAAETTPVEETVVEEDTSYEDTSSGSYEGGTDTVSRAYACLGAPYVWGGVGPDGYDCSGLVSYCLTGEHTRLGTTYTFMNWPMVSDPQPGDIAVNYSHTGVYIGDGQMIHASTYGVGVIVGAVQSGMIFVRYGG